jgi:hypothetical protein
MEQMTMLDAGFLQAEDSDRHVSLAIGAVAVLSGPMPDFDSVAVVLAERILSVPRFRHILRTQPLDLGAPRWVDDTNLADGDGDEKSILRAVLVVPSALFPEFLVANRIRVRPRLLGAAALNSPLTPQNKEHKYANCG